MAHSPLPTWTDRWSLSEDMINCVECHAPQFMQHRDSDFVHAPGCSRRGPGQRPYGELMEMLERALANSNRPASP